MPPAISTIDSASPKRTWRDNALLQGWLVLLLAVVFGALLAGVQTALGPAIVANKRNETLSRVPELIPPAAGAATKAELEIDTRMLPVARGGRTAVYRVHRALRDERLAGWVVQTAGQGYADRIEVLLGLSPQADVLTGLFVLDQKETPGLGAKIAAAPWRGQFVGKPAAVPLEVVKGRAAGGHQIDAVTGATISSRAVVDIVNRALADVRAQLAADAGKAAP
ncbi:MAG: FMN-binding protein [Desulfobacteraceae bacterium]|jgi:electron transport complex protein RnfG|nr:FMN-binding protein [Desulfobacteraceae bacterium]